MTSEGRAALAFPVLYAVEPAWPRFASIRASPSEDCASTSCADLYAQ